MKLRTKFFVIYSILMVIPVLLLTEYSYARFRHLATEQVSTYSENFVKNVNNQLNDSLGNLNNILNMLTFNPSTTSMISITDILQQYERSDSAEASYNQQMLSRYSSSIFQSLMLTDESVNGLYLFDSSANLISSTHNQNSINSSGYGTVLNHQWVKEIDKMSPGYYITGTTDASFFTDNKPSLYIGRSIRDIYTHKKLGYVLIDCDPSILNIEDQIKLEKMALVDVANSQSGEILYTNVTGKKARKTFSRSTHTQTIKLNISPLVLRISFDDSEIDRQLNPNLSLLFMILIIVIMAALLANYFVTSRMIAPIEHLSWTISHQGRDDLTFVNPYPARKDEIGTLYREYGSLLTRINDMIKTRYQDKLVLLDAQMKSLEARINSHFLFNTLESINSMAELDGQPDIATMSLALGNMFRYSIKTESELVPLSTELKNVDDYVSIQQIRFSGKFRLIKDVPAPLMDVKVLKLILQPLVENALYHGLEYCAVGDTITIGARQDHTDLLITVTDNGQGMDEETLSALQEKLKEEPSFTELGHRTNASIGIKNIHSRIELYYGRGYGLSVESRPQEGTTVTIRVPITE